MKYKKLINTFLSLILMISLVSLSVSADINLGAKDEAIPQDPKNEVRNQEKENELQVMPLYDPDAEYIVSVPVEKQITGYYCGPAAANCVLRSKKVNVPSTSKSNVPFFKGCPNNCPYPNVTHTCVANYNSPQVTLANSMGTTVDGTTISEISKVLNSRLGGNHYTYASTTSEEDLSKKIKADLKSGYPLIVWVNAKKLDRYQGSSFSGHFITLYQYSEKNKLVSISDPNYYAKYGGKYAESLNTLHRAMVRSNGAPNIVW